MQFCVSREPDTNHFRRFFRVLVLGLISALEELLITGNSGRQPKSRVEAVWPMSGADTIAGGYWLIGESFCCKQQRLTQVNSI